MFAVSRGVSSMEFGDLEALCKAVVKEKQPFERLEVSKETLLKMFKVSERGKTGVLCLTDKIHYSVIVVQSWSMKKCQILLPCCCFSSCFLCFYKTILQSAHCILY